MGLQYHLAVSLLNIALLELFRMKLSYHIEKKNRTNFRYFVVQVAYNVVVLSMLTA